MGIERAWWHRSEQDEQKEQGEQGERNEKDEKGEPDERDEQGENTQCGLGSRLGGAARHVLGSYYIVALPSGASVG